jgi:hypothetical protein
VGENPVRLRDLTLCTIAGTPVEEDWYAFPTGPIAFRANARLRRPDTPAYQIGASENICLEMLWYAEVNELAGAPPDLIRGPVCGPAAGLTTGEVGVRRSMGEAYSYILIHVYPGDGADEPVGYDLTFDL